MKRRTPPAPRGWIAVEDFPAPEPEPKPDLVADLRRSIRTEVAAGYTTPRAAMANIVGMFEDQAPAAEIRRLARPIFKAEQQRLEREQTRWPKVTDNDRLDAAFAELESHGILTRQNYLCCGTCGCAAIDDEIRTLKRRRVPVRGYVFFHEQDTESAVEGHGVCSTMEPRTIAGRPASRSAARSRRSFGRTGSTPHGTAILNAASR